MKTDQLKAGTIISYISILINIIIQLLYTPVMLRILGQSEYGIYTLSASIISYLSLFSLGFSGAYVRFYSRYSINNDKENIARLNAMFLFVFGILSLAAMLAGSVLVMNCERILGNKITKEELQTARILMQIMIFNVVLSLINSVFTSIIASREKYFFQRGIELLCKMFNPFLTLPLLLMGYGSIGMTCVTTLLTVLNLGANIVYVRNRLHEKFVFQGMQLCLLREIGAFSFWIFLNMIIDQINWNVDKMILGRTCGSREIASYGVGAQLNTLYLMFSTSISSVFGPRVNYLVAQGGREVNCKLTELFVKVGRMQYIVLLFIAGGITFFGRAFIWLWAGDEYDAAYFVVLFLIWPGIISSSQNLGIEIQRAKNMHKFRSQIYLVMAVFNILISIPLSMRYGAAGAAIGTANSIVIANIIIMNLYYHRRIGLNISKYWKNLVGFVPATISVFLMGILCNWLLTGNTWINLCLKTLFYSVGYGVIMWMMGMNGSEKNLILEEIHKFRERVKGE